MSIDTDLVALLAHRVPGFRQRRVQQDMAELIGRAIENREHALVEAGTGTGKTFAYLLPAISSGKKVVISTGTKTLQDQLFEQDIPLVNSAYGRSVAILKGRANYLCPQRLHQHVETMGRRSSQTVQEQLTFVHEWSERTRSGDLTEVLDGGDASHIHWMVTSTADNCLGHDCPRFDDCPLYRARDRAKAADIVVVNHHLFFADLSLKEEALGELLPEADILILDEAHQVAEVARNFYGDHLGSGQMLDLVRDVKREQLLVGSDDPALLEANEALASAIEALVKAVLQSAVPLRVMRRMHEHEIESMDMALSRLLSRLEQAAVRSTGLARCYSRACRLNDMFTLLTEETEADDVAHWVERRDKNFVLHMMPLDIATHLNPMMAIGQKTWLFVSATLAIGEKFDHIRKTLGMNECLEASYPSPFDFESQVAGYVPADLPLPSHPQHTASLMATMLPLVRGHQGRTLMLFTSHRALEAAAQTLSSEHDLVFVTQGALPKARLIEKFRSLPQCILLATHSFWEGVDLKGSDLRLLLIDKLPFTSPDDPVFQARLNLIDQEGGNSFRDLSLPEAAITLKQGFGRLVRQETDQGLFVLGDTRMLTKGYGKTLKNSLPPMRWLTDAEQALSFLEAISS